MATVYPAYNWVNTYATSNSITGVFAQGWYMPSAVELHLIYIEKTNVNNSLSKTNGNQIFGEESKYLSSSQNQSNKLMWFVNSNGDIDSGDYDDRVCAIREF